MYYEAMYKDSLQRRFLYMLYTISMYDLTEEEEKKTLYSIYV